MDGVDARGRPRWAVVAALVAAGPVAVVAARLAVALQLAASSPALPHLAPVPACPGAACTFSPLHAAPTVEQVRTLAPRGRTGIVLGELGPEWDAVAPAARPWIRMMLGRARAADPSAPPTRWDEGLTRAYGEALEAAWAAEAQRHVAERYLADRAEHRIATLRLASRWARLAPRPLELGLLAVWAAGVAGAAVWRERRRRVRVDAAGVEFHGERIVWERIDAVDWYERSVEVRLADGTLRRDRALALAVQLDVAERRTRALAGRG